jgi:hypothetical protein
VNVLPGRNYDILLLGGRYVNRLLLVTAFVNDLVDDGTSNDKFITGYTSSGTGVPIVAGKSNLITLAMEKLNLDISTAVAFTYGTGGTETSSTIIRNHSTAPGIAVLPLPKRIDGEPEPTLIMTIATNKFVDLIHARASVDPSPPLFKMQGTNLQGEVVLNPIGKQIFTPQIGNEVINDSTFANGNFAAVYTFANLPDEFSQKDIDAGLRYNYQYYAFGTEESGSSKWEIRNGVNHRLLDDGGVGGLIMVRVGDGSIKDFDIVIDIHF